MSWIGLTSPAQPKAARFFDGSEFHLDLLACTASLDLRHIAERTLGQERRSTFTESASGRKPLKERGKRNLRLRIALLGANLLKQISNIVSTPVLLVVCPCMG